MKNKDRSGGFVGRIGGEICEMGRCRWWVRAGLAAGLSNRADGGGRREKTRKVEEEV